MIPSSSTKMTSQVVYRLHLPGKSGIADCIGSPPENTLLFYDLYLKKIPQFERFRACFDKQLGVRAGEGLKNLEQWPKLMQRVVHSLGDDTSREITLLAVGGGTIGDVGGFIACTLKRGVRLVHVPSTWLSAMDSAFGGKTGLNLGTYKNQVGTFYPAERVVVCRHLLSQQKQSHLISAMGEATKMALIEGGTLFRQMLKRSDFSDRMLWEILPLLIRAKMKWVKKDPFETKGHRRVLNLGHTLGHALELYYHLPHGVAVALGSQFAIEWSKQKRILNKENAGQAMRLFSGYDYTVASFQKRRHRAMSAKTLTKLLRQDKKIDSEGRVDFVFLSEVGKPVRRKVSIIDIVEEAKRQGF